MIYNCQSLTKPLRRAILKKAFADLKQNIGKDKSPNTEDDIVRKSLCGTPPIIEMAMPFLCPQSSDSHNASSVYTNRVSSLWPPVDMTMEAERTDSLRNELLVQSLVNKCDDTKRERNCGGCGRKGHYITKCPEVLNQQAKTKDLNNAKSINWGDDLGTQPHFCFGIYNTFCELKSDLVRWSFSINKPVSFPGYKYDDQAKTNRTQVQSGHKHVACCSTMVIANVLIEPTQSNSPCQFYVAARLSKSTTSITPLHSNQYYHNIGY